MLAYTPVQLNFFKTLAKNFIIPARQNQFIHKNNFINAPVRHSAIAVNTKSAFTASYTKNPVPSQQFHHRQIKLLRIGQPIVNFDAADTCNLYITTRKAMNIQDDIPSIPTDFFKAHHVLLFDMTSMVDAALNCHYTELVGEPLRLPLNFTIPPEHVSELIVLGNECLWLQLKYLLFLEKMSERDNVSREEIIYRIPLPK